MNDYSAKQTCRGRPREFHVDAVVENAMNVFWSRGYQGTSLPDLLEATQLSRGSLYAAFGDKHGLFLQALDRYIETAIARLTKELKGSHDPVAGLRACVAGYVTRTRGAAGKRGCLVVASTMELAAHDPEVERRIRRFFDAMEAKFTETLTQAQANGSLAEGVAPATVARVLLCFLEGHRVVGKVAPGGAASSAAAQMIIDRFLS